MGGKMRGILLAVGAGGFAEGDVRVGQTTAATDLCRVEAGVELYCLQEGGGVRVTQSELRVTLLGTRFRCGARDEGKNFSGSRVLDSIVLPFVNHRYPPFG